jgi:hypothetical protein
MNVARCAFRGVIAAMAMTGLRRVTESFGLIEEDPPDQIAKETPLLDPILERIPERYHAGAIELVHWAYGAGGGALFGLVVPDHRQTRRAGVLYGLGTWVAFETGLVPLLGLSHGDSKEVSARVSVALDHVLYGLLVAGEQ